MSELIDTLMWPGFEVAVYADNRVEIKSTETGQVVSGKIGDFSVLVGGAIRRLQAHRDATKAGKKGNPS